MATVDESGSSRLLEKQRRERLHCRGVINILNLELHHIRVATLTEEITDIIYPKLCNDAIKIAMVHDIGKHCIPREILEKPDKLNKWEWQVIQEHPIIGAKVVSANGFNKSSADCIRHHHERWDGNGYPDGLIGSKIPLLSRIMAVADSYDAMVSERPYRKSLTHWEAIEEIRRCAGTQFDPQIVFVFMQLIKKEEEWQQQLYIKKQPHV